MSELLFEGAPLAFRRKDDVVEVGAVIHGKLFVFGGFKAGGFDADVQEALEAEQQAQQTQQ